MAGDHISEMAGHGSRRIKHLHLFIYLPILILKVLGEYFSSLTFAVVVLIVTLSEILV